MEKANTGQRCWNIVIKFSKRYFKNKPGGVKYFTAEWSSFGYTWVISAKEDEAESWGPLRGVLTHHTCCLHLHHREQRNCSRKTQQEVSKRPSYLLCRYPGQARCSSSFPLLPLVPLFSSHPHPCLRLLFYLFLPVSSFLYILPSLRSLPSPVFSPTLGENVSLSHLSCWVTEVTLLISSIWARRWLCGPQQSALTFGPITDSAYWPYSMPLITT